MQHPPFLGRYQVEAKLGEGGMAEIFLARIPGEGPVVLKRLLPEYRGDAEFLDMFRDEARISSSLKHPNIVQVFEINESEGLPWLVMEYLNGPTASQLVKQQRSQNSYDFARAARVMEMVARALDYAHEATDKGGKTMHLVHRDVSPSNIMVGRDGVTKLLDFGVARADGRSTRTKTGVMKGKTAFMSPEQINGEKLDGRTDIFAAGVCLYALTTGHLPFTAEVEIKILNKIVAGDLTPPRYVVPDYPRALEGIVLRALANERGRRYKNAGEFADALRDFAPAPRAGISADTAKWVSTLFPEWDDDQARRIGEGRRAPAASLTGLTPVSDRKEGSDRPPQPAIEQVSQASMTMSRPGRSWALGGVSVVVAIGAVAGGLSWSRLSTSSDLPRAVAPDAGRGSDSDLAVLLKMAERLRAEGKTEESAVVVGQAQALSSGTPEQKGQLTRLRIDLGILSAQRLVLDGQPDEAERVLAGVLAIDAQNADALELLAGVRDGRVDAGDPVTPAAPRVLTGKVLVDSTPSAEVFVEDVSQGSTPLELALAPGPHKLVLKRSGYQPQAETVRASLKKTVKVKYTLTRGGGTGP